MKKTLIVLTALLLVVSSVFAGGKKESQVAKEEPVTLRIAWWGSQARHDRTLAVLDLYSQKTGVQFEAEFLPFDGYFTKLNMLVAAGDAYDIIQLGSNFPNYLDSLEPLDKYISSGIIDVSQTSENALIPNRLNGNLYGISLGTNTYGIAYDPALFAAAGVPEPTVDWTWAEYEAACLQIHEKLGIYGSSKLDDFSVGASQRIPQHDKNQMLFLEDGSGLGYTDDYPIIDYFRIRKNLVDAGAYPDPGRINEIKDIESDYLVRGEAAMTQVATNQFVALVNAAGRELKLATLPRETKDGPCGTSMQSSQMFGVYSGSEHKEEAAAFISFFVNDLEANRILKGERGQPIMASVCEDLEKNAEPAQAEIFRFIAIMTQIAEASAYQAPAQETEIKDLFWRIEDLVVFGKLTPEEAAVRFRTEAEAIFEKTK
ncbi:MAG: ABC transporter substrate-binding protein [Treponemataceae bacterium]|nr:ABC transporter substrate-binding protein [Treponemataceae bacterium]